MNLLQTLFLALLLGALTEACKARTDGGITVATAPQNQNNSKDAQAGDTEDEGDEGEGGDEGDEEGDGKPEPEVIETLEDSQKLNKELAEKIVELENQKKTAEDELKKAKETLVPRVVPVAGQKGPSGFNYCPTAGYYGHIIACGNYFCAKADPQYNVDCEAHTGSKQALLESGFPDCPGYVFGAITACGAKFCGFSDAGQTKRCQVD